MPLTTPEDAAEIQRPSVWRPWVDALNARRRVVHLIPLEDDPGEVGGDAAVAADPPGNLRNLPAVVSGGAYVVIDQYGVPNSLPLTTRHAWTWATFQSDVDQMRPYFLDPAVTEPPTNDDPVNSTVFPSLADRPDDEWPKAGGWTRKYERAISSLSAGGSDGQRARFLFCDGVTAVPDLDTDHDALTGRPVMPTSPPGEVAYARKVMVRQGGAWVVAADQAEGPDVLTRYGRIRHGDIVGPWFWDDVGLALGQLVQTAGVASLTGRSRSGGASYGIPPGNNGSWDESQTYAEAAFAAATAADFDGQPFAIDARDETSYPLVGMVYNTTFPSTSWSSGLLSREYNLGSYEPEFTDIPRTFEAWALPGNLSGYGGPATEPFDDNGFGLPEGEWVLIGGGGPTTDEHAPADVAVGDADQQPHRIATPYPGGGAATFVRGWELRGVYCRVTWQFDD